jgi:hypothetical protein
MAMSQEQIRLEILNTPGLTEQARDLARQVLLESKHELIQEFNNHPVTKEIAAGPNAANSSGTLGNKGNLFSFIGFDEGSNPIEPIKSLLEKIELSQSKPRIASGSIIQFKVNMPNDSEFENASKMPWESGRSWLYDIERTISGLGQYLYGQFKKSRSGTGMQIENNITSKTFVPVRYFSTMLDKFTKKLKA